MNVEEQAAEFQKTFQRIRSELQKAIVGQEEILEGVITALFAGGHVLLEGVPGLGKTLLVRTLAQCVRLSFSRIQFTPDLMPSDITGTTILSETDEGKRTFRFQPGAVFASIVLADEINRATPKTQSAMLEAMQEQSVTAGGAAHMLPQPFFVLATQNPIEQEGTYPLPEAQLDRFLLKLLVPSPSFEEMEAILDRTTGAGQEMPQPVIDAETIMGYRQFCRQTALAPHMRDFAIRLALGTHPSSELATSNIKKFVRYGASPRGAQALVACAKVRALAAGRFNVAIDDLKAAALPALRHRVLLNFEGQAEEISTDTLIQELLEQVSAQMVIKVPL